MIEHEHDGVSALRQLEQELGSRPGEGDLAVVLARAGVGKSGLLVQIGMDHALRSEDVLHIGLGQALSHVEREYDAAFDDLVTAAPLSDRELAQLHLRRHRVIQAFPEHRLSIEQLERAVALYAENMRFRPSALIIDGYDWSGPAVVRAAELGAFKAYARRLGASLWMSGQSHRDKHAPQLDGVIPPCDELAPLLELVLFLQPDGDGVTVRLLKGGDGGAARDTRLRLAVDTLRPQPCGDTSGHPAPGCFTLLSGGAEGAERCFGEQAERWGLAERNYTYAGRTPARDRHLVELGEDELHRGDVSDAYLREHLHRSLSDRPELKKVVQTIWHQVATAGEVFVIGRVQDDGTVQGGTGWAAELGKRFGKPTFAFDQPSGQWQQWSAEGWQPVEAPKITATRFTGTGTRKLDAAGREAIEQLFERSFSA